MTKKITYKQAILAEFKGWAEFTKASEGDKLLGSKALEFAMSKWYKIRSFKRPTHIRALIRGLHSFVASQQGDITANTAKLFSIFTIMGILEYNSMKEEFEPKYSLGNDHPNKIIPTCPVCNKTFEGTEPHPKAGDILFRDVEDVCMTCKYLMNNNVTFICKCEAETMTILDLEKVKEIIPSAKKWEAYEIAWCPSCGTGFKFK